MPILQNEATNFSPHKSLVHKKGSAMPQKMPPLKINFRSMPKYIQIQLPDSLSHWFDQQVVAMRDTLNSVSILTVENNQDMENKVRSAMQVGMPDEPRMADFILAGSDLCDITKKGTLYLSDGFGHHLGPIGRIEIEESEDKIIIRKGLGILKVKAIAAMIEEKAIEESEALFESDSTKQ